VLSPIRGDAESAGGVACLGMRRARRGLTPALAGATALAVSLSLAACGDSGDATAAGQTNSQTTSQSSSQSSSNQSGSQSQSSTNQNGTQSSTQGSGSISQSSFSTDRGTIRTFAGTSDATLTIDVDAPSRLLWSNDRGSRFRLSGPGLPAINSLAGSGESALASGEHRIQVHGDVWTVVVRPR
jgi:type IV secretory pathway TrbL component